jgi:hypothetical protein
VRSSSLSKNCNCSGTASEAKRSRNLVGWPWPLRGWAGVRVPSLYRHVDSLSVSGSVTLEEALEC